MKNLSFVSLWLVIVTLISACGSGKMDDGKVSIPEKQEGTTAPSELFGSWKSKAWPNLTLTIQSDKLTCQSIPGPNESYDKGKVAAKLQMTANTIEIQGSFEVLETVDTYSSTMSCMRLLNPNVQDFESPAEMIRVTYKIANGVLTIYRHVKIPSGFTRSQQEFTKK